MKRALLIGRYQPPHLGHLAMIKHILETNDELVVVVAAAQMSYSVKNPFTAGERLTMLRMMLKDHNIDLNRIWLIPVQDVLDNDIWVTHLMRMVPKVDTIYGNNPFTKILFKQDGYEMTPTPLFQRSIFEARQIRDQLREGKVSSLNLSDKVLVFLNEIKATERMQALYGNDSENFEDANSEIS